MAIITEPNLVFYAKALLALDNSTNPSVLSVETSSDINQCTAIFKSLLPEGEKFDAKSAGRRVKKNDSRVIGGKKAMKIEASLFASVYHYICQGQFDYTENCTIPTLITTYSRYLAFRESIKELESAEDIPFKDSKLSINDAFLITRSLRGLCDDGQSKICTCKKCSSLFYVCAKDVYTHSDVCPFCDNKPIRKMRS